MTDIRPLVIGLGVAGKRHLDAQLNLGITTGIYTTNPQTVESLKKQKNILVFDNLEQGLNWANLVHVCTPDDKHTEFVTAAIKRGKTVFCEKSFTTSLKDALYLQRLAHKYGVSVLVGQNYRLTPTFAETKRRILENMLGTVTRIETTYFHDQADFRKRYNDKYFLFIGGSHAVDLACWLTGQSALSVKAFSKSNLNFDITIEFSSGIEGHIRLDADLPRSVSGTHLIAYGEKGELISHNKSDQLSFYENGNRKTRMMVFPNTKTFTIPLEVKIIDDYLLGKRGSFTPLPAVDEAINTIKILEAIRKSVSSGKNEKV